MVKQILRYIQLTSISRRNNRRRWLRLWSLFLAPQPGNIVLKFADRRIFPRFRRRLASNPAIDWAFASLAQSFQMARIRGRLSGPRQRFRDIGQCFATIQFISTFALCGSATAAPFPQNVRQLRQAGSSTTLIRRGGFLWLIRRRYGRDLCRWVASPGSCTMTNKYIRYLYFMSHFIGFFIYFFESTMMNVCACSFLFFVFFQRKKESRCKVCYGEFLGSNDANVCIVGKLRVLTLQISHIFILRNFKEWNYLKKKKIHKILKRCSNIFENNKRNTLLKRTLT